MIIKQVKILLRQNMFCLGKNIYQKQKTLIIKHL
uniref:Uncharacterized protein n=1 Tax=Siphoviridae sp. ctCS019 TaxID=2825378 RepID=A0A8S5U5B0_9CAUD|nr:MAG TPA: hypothetical protein [Siphoviridae sp. ctCS019]